MAKSLNDILKGVNKSKVIPGSTGDDPGVDYAEKSKDGRDFVAQHKVEKHEDRVGNGADVYNASKVKQSKDEKHGHTPDPKAKTTYKQHNESSCSSDSEPRYNGKNKKGRQLLTDKKKIQEREMTADDKKKEERLKDKYDDSSMKANMQKQYGDEKGKQVYFAYIRKQAMKSEQADTNIKTSSGNVGDTGRV
jgi:hypothetical protein